MEAVGVYIDRLTELRGLKVKVVAERAGVKPGYVSRIISRDIEEPPANKLWALNEAVGGSWEDVGVLLDPKATRLQAEALADAWYVRSTGSAEDREKVRRRLLAAVDELLNDEDRLRQELRQS